MVTDYSIIVEESQFEMEKTVKRLLKEGYQPLGSVQYITNGIDYYYLQTMVMYASTPQ